MRTTLLLTALTFSVTALGAPCSAEQLATLKRYTMPDVETNSEAISSLFDSAIAGEAACEIAQSELPSPGGRIAMCGAAYPESQEIVTIANGGFTVSLTVQTDVVQCSGGAKWLKAISTSKGNVEAVLRAGDKLMAQVKTDGCIKAEDYLPVRFITESYFGTTTKRVKLLYQGSDASCVPQAEQDGIIEFSMDQLGLTASDLTDLH